MLNALLCFGMQNKSRLEASIITKMPEKQARNSNTSNLNDRRLPYCLLLVPITETHGLFRETFSCIRNVETCE